MGTICPHLYKVLLRGRLASAPKVNVERRYFTVSDAGCWITPLTSLVESGDFVFVLLGIQEFRNYLSHPTYPPKSSRLFDFRIVFLWGGVSKEFRGRWDVTTNS